MIRKIRDIAATLAFSWMAVAAILMIAFFQQQGIGIGLIGELILALAVALGVTIVAAWFATRLHQSFAPASSHPHRPPDYGEVFRRYVFRFGVFVAPIAASFGAVRIIETLMSAPQTK